MATPRPPVLRAVHALPLGLLALVLAVTAGPEQPVGVPAAGALAGGSQDSTVAAGGTSQSLVVWTDLRSGFQEIRAARVATDGTVLDPFGLRLGTGSSPAVAWDGTDTYLVVWQSGLDISAARVRAPDGAVLDSTPLSVAASANEEAAPAVAFAAPNFFVVWQVRSGPGNWKVVGRRMSPAGTLVDATDRTVSGFPISSVTCTSQAIASSGTGYLVAFTCKDFGASTSANVHGALLDAAGTLDPMGDLDISLLPDTEANPAVAFNGTEFLVAWDGGGRVHLRWYSTAGAQTGAADPTTTTGVDPIMGCAGGDCGLGWRDTRTSSNSHLYGAKTRSNRTLDTEVALVTNNNSKTQPALVHASTSLLLAWSEQDALDRNILGQRLDTSLGALGGVFPLSTAGASQQGMIAVSGAAGETLLVWQERRVGSVDLLATRINASGVRLDSPPLVISGAAFDQQGADAAFDPVNNRYLVVWQDNRAGVNVPQIFGVLVESGVVGAEIPITTAATPKSGPKVAYGAGVYEVVFQEDWSIRAVRVSATGVPAAQRTVEPGTSADTQLQPGIGFGAKFLVAWTYDTQGFSEGRAHFIATNGAIESTLLRPGGNTLPVPRIPVYSVFGYAVLSTGASQLDSVLFDSAGGIAGDLGITTPGLNQGPFSLVRDGSQYFLVWLSAGQVVGKRVSTGGSAIDATPVVLFSTSTPATIPAAARVGPDLFTVGYQRYEPTAPYSGVGGFYRQVNMAATGSDVSPPEAGAVSDGVGADLDLQLSTTSLDANWSGFVDPESGIAGYRWWVGTTAGGLDLQAPATVGTAASAQASGLSLSTGTRYYVTVEATNGSGLTVTASSDGVVVDGTPPVLGFVHDGPGADLDVTASATALEANWSADDPESGIIEVAWAIGTTAGGAEVQPFTPVGIANLAAASGLALQNGQTYFVTVRATNGLGQTAQLTSDGITRVVPFAQVRFVSPPTTATAGLPLEVTVEVLDGSGARATGFGGSVRFVSNDPEAQLPSQTAYLAEDQGLHLFPGLVFWAPGTTTLTVEEVGGSGLFAQLTVEVQSPVFPVIRRDANPVGALGMRYRLNATNTLGVAGEGPITFERCGGPEEFAVDPQTGAVSWTPVAPGVVTVCVTARNAAGEDSYSFPVQVADRYRIACGCSSGSGSFEVGVWLAAAMLLLRRRAASQPVLR
ncbi:MAG: hypothetical protein M3Y59_17625 [Myxococcota bacterium]|nr:hypothetical protein [Myxococcota bacterium]